MHDEVYLSKERGLDLAVHGRTTIDQIKYIYLQITLK
jgi:hypothetical protein